MIHRYVRSMKDELLRAYREASRASVQGRESLILTNLSGNRRRRIHLFEMRLRENQLDLIRIMQHSFYFYFYYYFSGHLEARLKRHT